MAKMTVEQMREKLLKLTFGSRIVMNGKMYEVVTLQRREDKPLCDTYVGLAENEGEATVAHSMFSFKKNNPRDIDPEIMIIVKHVESIRCEWKAKPSCMNWEFVG
jgi:hypothetical protein